MSLSPKTIFSTIGYARLLYLLLLAAFNLYEPKYDFDLPNLLWFTHLMLLYIHEAGHLFFGIFGRTISILGGSLMQVLAPLAWYFVALYEHSRLSNVALVFTGISLIDVSIYIKDAAVLQLPLIGGLSKTHHDWLNLLNKWEMLDWSWGLGEIIFWIGMLVSLYGIGNGMYSVIHDFKQNGDIVEG